MSWLLFSTNLTTSSTSRFLSVFNLFNLHSSIIFLNLSKDGLATSWIDSFHSTGQLTTHESKLTSFCKLCFASGDILVVSTLLTWSTSNIATFLLSSK